MVVVVVELYATKVVPLVVQEVVQETVVTAKNILQDGCKDHYLYNHL